MTYLLSDASTSLLANVVEFKVNYCYYFTFYKFYGANEEHLQLKAAMPY